MSILVNFKKLLNAKFSRFKENSAYKLGFKSFSQEGEDRMLDLLLTIINGYKNLYKGFYVDIGAFHPFKFSNTNYFYQKGWQGINIDANPESIKIFNKYRKRDINICSCISNKKDSLNYYLFNEPAVNTFDEKNKNEKIIEKNWYIIGSIRVKPHSLKKILHSYIKPKRKIDFMNIDVEGLELNVLKSNNWKIYRPKILVVEILNKLPEDICKSEIYKYLNSQGYFYYSKLHNSTFFIDKLYLNLFYKNNFLHVN